jgi:hypothetical protein
MCLGWGILAPCDNRAQIPPAWSAGWPGDHGTIVMSAPRSACLQERSATGQRSDLTLPAVPANILAGTLIGTVPLLAVFLLLGRHIVGGIMQGAIKG